MSKQLGLRSSGSTPGFPKGMYIQISDPKFWERSAFHDFIGCLFSALLTVDGSSTTSRRQMSASWLMADFKCKHCQLITPWEML